MEKASPLLIGKMGMGLSLYGLGLVIPAANSRCGWTG